MRGGGREEGASGGARATTSGALFLKAPHSDAYGHGGDGKKDSSAFLTNYDSAEDASSCVFSYGQLFLCFVQVLKREDGVWMPESYEVLPFSLQPAFLCKYLWYGICVACIRYKLE